MNFSQKSNVTSSEKRRSSSRSIKRKKFDDELVESSLVKTGRVKAANVTFSTWPSTVALTSTHNSPFASTSTSQIGTGSFNISLTSKPKLKPQRKHVSNFQNNTISSTKVVKRWKASDDLALILSIQQTNNLETVFRGVEFSCKFSLQEVKERWYALLYVAHVSKPAFDAMKQLPSDIVAQIKAKVLFSAEEENLIASINSADGSMAVFQQLLVKNVKTFLPERTAKALYDHWILMKQFNLLLDQTVHITPAVDSVLSFSDTEDLMDDSKLQDDEDSDLVKETIVSDRIAKREIKQLENELPKWQVLVDSIVSANSEEFHANTLAVLKGRIVRYLMQSREITLGRSSKDSSVDVDLLLEGPASKISRRQGTITMENSGDFFIMNEARRPIYVDGKPILTGKKIKIGNESVVEIVGLKLIFLVNKEHILSLRNKIKNCSDTTVRKQF